MVPCLLTSTDRKTPRAGCQHQLSFLFLNPYLGLHPHGLTYERRTYVVGYMPPQPKADGAPSSEIFFLALNAEIYYEITSYPRPRSPTGYVVTTSPPLTQKLPQASAEACWKFFNDPVGRYSTCKRKRNAEVFTASFNRTNNNNNVNLHDEGRDTRQILSAGHYTVNSSVIQDFIWTRTEVIEVQSFQVNYASVYTVMTLDTNDH